MSRLTRCRPQESANSYRVFEDQGHTIAPYPLTILRRRRMGHVALSRKRAFLCGISDRTVRNRADARPALRAKEARLSGRVDTPINIELHE